MTRPRDVTLHGPGRLRASIVIGMGLLLALLGTIAPTASPSGAPGASLVVRLPDAARTLVVVLLALSAVLLLSLQRRRTDREAVPIRLPRRPAGWMALLPLLVTIGAVWFLTWLYWSGGDDAPIAQAFTAIAGLLQLLAHAGKPGTSVPLFDYAIAALLVLLALALFALLAVIALGDRLAHWWAGPAAAGAAAMAPRPIADDRDDLRAEPDARTAILRAYGRFERLLAAARAPRAPWQTPAEFMRTSVARLSLPRPSVARLTALFELARFSDRPLDTAARDTACDSLDEIGAALRTQEESCER
jgi:hypothetical protein